MYVFANKMYDFYDSEIVKNFTLSEEAIINERKIVESNKREISSFQKQKLLDEGKKNWDKFYNHYKTKFFKDRKWIEVEFEHIFKNETDDEENGKTINDRNVLCPKNNDCSCEDNRTDFLKKKKTILEMGCGVGNTLIPLLIKYDNFCCIGIDFSENAIRLLNEKWKRICEWNYKLKQEKGEKEDIINEKEENIKKFQDSMLLTKIDKTNASSAEFKGDLQKTKCEYKDGRATVSGTTDKTVEVDEMDENFRKTNESASDEESVEEYFQLTEYKKMGTLIKTFVADITEEDTPSYICELEKVDIVLLIFVLSAIHPEKMKNVITHAHNYLKKGGHVILRDYGLYDLSQIRFAKKKNKRISENFYFRGDKTFVYFFKTEELHDLFCKDNRFKEVENRYITRIVKNRKRDIEMKRIWVQAIFKKI